MNSVIISSDANVRERALWPGWSASSPGIERYRVPGGGAITVAIEAGDRLSLIDVEGAQTCLLTTFDPNWKAAPEIFGTKPNRKTDDLDTWLSQSDSNTAFASRLKNLGVDFGGLVYCSFFGPDSGAGEQIDLVASGSGVVVAIAPGGPMQVEKQNPPTEIEIRILRSKPQEERDPVLPEPLADPLQDFRINRATASSYEVKAGEFIQIIDVQGQQCTDFQAFSVPALDKGIERCLDVTTTRTLMAQGYPGPGQHAKYYDQDLQPLLEIVQDHCTRHDAFGLACTAKYYDDTGYPRHVNCSENFNYALKKYAVQPRPGWMAMNFFYNTGIDDANQFYLDEPWSRPGDYVLLQALTDLVCVSSACPDEISAANGWNPTDMHIRTYSPKESFRRSVGYRKSPEANVTMTQETGFHARTSELTRDFVEYNGYWMPNSFTNHGAIAEYWACREKCIIMDLSALRKFEVIGTDAELLMQRCLTRNIRKMSDGHVMYTAMCYDTGTMIDDGTLFRLGPDNFRWIGGSDYGGEWLRTKAEELGLKNVRIKSSTDQLHNLAIQGPLSREILNNVIWTPPSQPGMEEMEWFRFAIGRIGEANGIPVIVSRTGYSGELGYEVFCHPGDGPAVWDAIWEAGAPKGMLPLGLEALDMLRIESGLIFAGYEFDDQTDPFEAGIGFTVPLKTKQEDFIGREALVTRKESPQRKLVGLELIGDETAAHGDCVRVGRHQVGIVTSAMRSPILMKNVALCRMSVEHAEVGTEVEVGKLDGHSKRLPATVVPFPFYDPKKERPRS
jgi:aminomethyltransferase